jgi:hypothetical protein
MLWDCEFQLPSGRHLQPFARAPWADDPGLESLPAHMRHLGGEFVCVPFGIGGRPPELAPAWESASWDRINPEPHGRSANEVWALTEASASEVCLRLDYPAHDDVAHLIRRVTAVPDEPALDFELTIHARRRTRQPVGLHPILRLPDFPAQLHIQAEYKFGLTYPAFVPPGASRVAAGQRFARLEALSGIKGGTVDYSTLPKDSPTEEMLMLCGVTQPITVRYPAERAWLRLTWDTAVLPSCLIWPSDRALTDPPWSGRFRGIGLEPIAAVFDAAREVAVEGNPINAAGIATAVEITPQRPLIIRYRIEAGDE